MSNYHDKIDKIKFLAEASKLRRLAHSPLKYLSGQMHSKLIYRLSKKGKLKEVNTFFNERMNVLLPAGLDIYLLGGKSHDSEIRLAKFLCNHLKKGDHMIDVGAHFGYFSLLASKLVGDEGKVFGIEAAKETYNIYKTNVSKISNISPNHLACSDQSGKIKFHEFPILYSEYNTLDPSQYENEKWYDKNRPAVTEVQSTRLDSFIEDQNANPKIIKIDVEGAEESVVNGMSKTVKQERELFIVMEYLLKKGDESTSHSRAADYLINLNYIPHKINKKGVTERIENIETYMDKQKMYSDNIVFC